MCLVDLIQHLKVSKRLMTFPNYLEKLAFLKNLFRHWPILNQLGQFPFLIGLLSEKIQSIIVSGQNGPNVI